MRYLKLIILAVTAVALTSLSSCSKQKQDPVGDLMDEWVLDTKTVTVADGTPEVTDFSGDYFFLQFKLYGKAFTKQGLDTNYTISEGALFSYDEENKQIVFHNILSQTKGYPPKLLYLFNKFDVLELTGQKLVISQTVKNLKKEMETTVYSFHRYQKDGE